MGEELVIGVELLDYMSELMEVAQTLMRAKSTVESMQGTFGGKEIYEGDAREPIETYLSSLYNHLERLIAFYTKAASYAYNTYESMYQSDEAMAVWLLKTMEARQVTKE